MQPNRPKISRKPIVLLVSICLLLAAVLAPMALRLPRWIEIEIVLGAWWLIWVIALTVLLYRGHSVDDDAKWTGIGYKTGSLNEWFHSRNDRYSGCANMGSGCGDISGCFDEGCGSILLAIAAFILLGLAFLLLFELVIPALALLSLASIGGMFARAVNDTHGCEGRLGVSLFWGALWATVYIAPILAIAIWVANYLK